MKMTLETAWITVKLCHVLMILTSLLLIKIYYKYIPKRKTKHENIDEWMTVNKLTVNTVKTK